MDEGPVSFTREVEKAKMEKIFHASSSKQIENTSYLGFDLLNFIVFLRYFFFRGGKQDSSWTI